MSRRIYLVLLLLLVAIAATGVYLRQRAKVAAASLRQSSGQAANCDTPAPPAPSHVEGPPPQTTPPPALSSVEGPKLPGFAIEAACGTGTEAPKAAEKKK